GGEQLRYAQDVRRLDVVLERDGVGTRADRHHRLLQRGVAGTFADAVDGGFDLTHAGTDRRQRVGDREAQVVVVVRGQHDLVCTGDAGADHGEDALHVLGQCVANGVGYVDR